MVLEELRQCAKGELDEKRVWTDLPGLAICVDSYYTDRPTYEGEVFTTEAAHVWQELSIFGARGMAVGVLAPYIQAMYAVQSGLEQQLNTLLGPEMAEWRVKIACAWLTHGAKPLFWWARESESYGNVDDSTNHIQRGPLYDGPAIMCFERWRLWLGGVQELAKHESGLSEETRQAAAEVVQLMREVEESMISMWS